MLFCSADFCSAESLLDDGSSCSLEEEPMTRIWWISVSEVSGTSTSCSVHPLLQLAHVNGELGICKRHFGVDFKLVDVGDGRSREELEGLILDPINSQ